MTVRHPELEAELQAIEELDSPRGRELMTVHADYLLAAGDPRGELASLQLHEPASPELAERLAALAPAMFGSAAEWVGRNNGVRVTWVGGWITELEVSFNVRFTPEDPWLTRLLERPELAQLRSLKLGDGNGLERDFLARSSCRASLRTLKLGAGYWGRPAPEVELGHLPRLRSLRTAAIADEWNLLAPELRSLSCDTYLSQVLELLHHARPSGLVELYVELQTEWEAAGLAALLADESLAQLRVLRIGTKPDLSDNIVDNSMTIGDMGLDMLLAAPLLQRLEVLDLAMARMGLEQWLRVRPLFEALDLELIVPCGFADLGSLDEQQIAELVTPPAPAEPPEPERRSSLFDGLRRLWQRRGRGS